jgi:hypothetical protein
VWVGLIEGVSERACLGFGLEILKTIHAAEAVAESGIVVPVDGPELGVRGIAAGLDARAPVILRDCGAWAYDEAVEPVDVATPGEKISRIGF